MLLITIGVTQDGKRMSRPVSISYDKETGAVTIVTPMSCDETDRLLSFIGEMGDGPITDNGLMQ